MTTLHPTSLLLADPSPYAQAGLTCLLERRPQLHVAGIADTVTALSLDRDHILVAHFRAFGSAPIPAIGRICREGLVRAIVVVVDSVDYAPEIINEGAAAVVTRDDDAAILHRAIEAAATGHTFRSPDVADYCDQRRKLMEDFDLSSAEARALQCFAHGLGRSDMTAQLMTAARTIGNHVSKLRKVTGCYEIIQMVAWYVRRYGVPADGLAIGCPNCIAAQASQDAVLELPAPDLMLELPARDNVLELPLRDNVLEVGAPETIPTEAAPMAVELTPEQHEFVHLHRSGYTSAAVAKLRNVHASTIRRAMQKIRDRVGCATNTDLFAWYAERYDAVLELPARDAVLDLTPADLVLEFASQDVVAVVTQPALPPAEVRPARRHMQPLRWLHTPPSRPAYRSHRPMSHAQAQQSRPTQGYSAARVSARSLGDPPSARPLDPLARAAPPLAQARAAPRLTHGIAPPFAAERWGGLPCVR